MRANGPAENVPAPILNAQSGASGSSASDGAGSPVRLPFASSY